MLGAIVKFAVLFAAIKVFERSRDDLDNFSILTAAIVPVLVAWLVQLGAYFVLENTLVISLLSLITFAGLTFYLVHAHLSIPIGRAVAYTALMIFVDIGLALLLF